MSERVLSSGGSEAASSWRGRDVGRRAPGAQVSLPQHVTPQEVLWAGCVAFVLKNVAYNCRAGVPQSHPLLSTALF